MITGASMKQVRKMVFRENMLIASVAIIKAIVLGLVIAPLFLMVTKRVLQVNSFGMYIPIQAIALTIILFAILFCIVSKFITRFINKEEAVHLLKADVTQEKINCACTMEVVTISNYQRILSTIAHIRSELG